MPFAGVGFWTVWSQFFPGNKAPLTENTIPSQKGRVFIVTGGSSGLGYELSKILYRAGGRVYILSRTKANVDKAIESIEKSATSKDGDEPGVLRSIHLDLEDLTSVRDAALEFLRREERLDVLFNNAGVTSIPAGTKTKQDIEYHIGVNVVGHVLLEALLRPVLSQTAKTAAKDTVRVIWSASILVELGSSRGGVRVETLDKPGSDIGELYAASKVGSWFVASEITRRFGRDTGVVQVAGNPGNYVTNVWRTTPGFIYYPFRLVLRNPVYGAYTYLWMALAEEVTMDDAMSGKYATCNGRWHPGQRDDLLLALRGKDEGGTGQASAFYEWCHSKITPCRSTARLGGC
ncbi:NAD(P)-binding protein [Lophiostoma macrostomum CBS 122681]|uniref:NAD(P)-binding protein n=1 Tax=Lophiostoma macrostomum CBS 122681 TaxID=1314788 RepID=A0A6A6T9V9_9PLEO|nr:NAD(P)-binding protein [Lophiostoma macrostomum CBS 122681]